MHKVIHQAMTRSCIVLVTALLFVSTSTPAGQSEDLPLSPDSGSRAEILWDTWGVPHISAQTPEDLGYAYGWSQMRSHANKILRLYGIARGRGAEYWGEGYLKGDRFLRTAGIPRAGVESYEAQEPGFRRYLDAFVEGMNAYAKAHPEAITEEVRSVLPVEGADPLRHCHRTLTWFLTLTNTPALLDMSAMPIADTPGSNAWAIGSSRSASGNALLLANPHLSWVDDLGLFFEAHLSAPGINLYGVTLLGLPVVAIGFNQHLGWTHTVNTLDGLDTYRLQCSGGGYRFDGAIRSFETEQQTLLVKHPDGLKEKPLLVRHSAYGPVIQMEDSTALAIRVVGLDQHDALKQWWDMGRAEDFAGFEAALKHLQIPMFNVVYADNAGQIFYLFGGRVPVRPFGDFAYWSNTVRGDTSGTLWTQTHPYADLPKTLNPTSGFVQNSNSPPWFATVPSPLDPAMYPAYMSPQWLDFREQRGIDMLLADKKITFDELLSMRHSNRALLADRVLDDLIPLARASGDSLVLKAAEVLDRWDHHFNAESRGAVLFSFWASEPCQVSWECGFSIPWDAQHPLSTPDGIANPDSAVSALKRAATKVLETFGAIDIPWGVANRIGSEPGFPGVGAQGDPLGVFHVIWYAPAEPKGFRAVGGDTYVAAIEFTPDGPRAEVILGYGNASQPGSPHLGDQLHLLARQEMRPAWLTRKEIEAHLETRETLH